MCNLAAVWRVGGFPSLAHTPLRPSHFSISRVSSDASGRGYKCTFPDWDLQNTHPLAMCMQRYNIQPLALKQVGAFPYRTSLPHRSFNNRKVSYIRQLNYSLGIIHSAVIHLNWTLLNRAEGQGPQNIFQSLGYEGNEMSQTRSLQIETYVPKTPVAS